MSVSSISATPLATPVASSSTPSAPPPSNDNDSDDSSSSPPAQAPLPPGQGTRIDRLA